MIEYTLRLELETDTCFSMGEGTAGLVDQEIQHDAKGCPIVPGRTLKGLLSEEAANFIATIENLPVRKILEDLYFEAFGRPGASADDEGCLRIGNAELPSRVRSKIHENCDTGHLTPEEILASLTDIRRQTAVNYTTNAPKKHSLRSTRVLVRGLLLEAPVRFSRAPTDDHLMLISLSGRMLRRAGINRNRGMGKINCTFLDEKGTDITDKAVQQFEDKIRGGML